MSQSLAEYRAHRARLPLTLSALVHAAMKDAMQQGMLPGECAETVAAAAADLLRSQYGDSMCRVLAQKVIDRAGQGFQGSEQ